MVQDKTLVAHRPLLLVIRKMLSRGILCQSSLDLVLLLWLCNHVLNRAEKGRFLAPLAYDAHQAVILLS